MDKPSVAIIIPVRNRATEMKRLLQSVAMQDYPASLISVIVVDALSNDNTQAVCLSFPFVKLIELPAERHVSRNRGVTESKGKYLIQLDSDMEMTSATISTLIKIAEEGEFDLLSIPERSTGDTLWAKARALEKVVIDDDLDRCGARFMTREAFNAVGGYDEEILFSEDYNIHTRLIQAGFRHRVAKETFVYHHESCTILEAARKQFYYCQTAYLYWKKFKTATVRQFHPLRPAYLKHLKLIGAHPVLFAALMFGKTLTYITGFSGMCYGYFRDQYCLRRNVN
jgi:glycosyltransferase involved in cell wall biosynthesis